jgi:uncharacterized phage protein (TIGR01671 family)
MRSIKFRAWIVKDKEWLNDFSVSTDGEIVNESNWMMDPEKVILMQSTGLTDKNGKDIFEGDVLGGFFENGFIKWCDKCKALQYSASGFCFACEGDVHWYELVEDEGTLEVIGNVYENPELLEKI